MKVFAWIVLAIVLFVILGMIYYLAIGKLIFKVSFGRKTLKKRVEKKNLQQQLKDLGIDLCWWDKVSFQKMEIKSVDGLQLVGHYFENNSNKTAIVVHGYGANYKEMQPYCKFFLQKKFNVLVTENRAHGQSEGECVGFGWNDRLDIVQWCKTLSDKNPENKIVLFGLSMGATAVCCTVGEDLPYNVVGAISDSAFAFGKKQIADVLSKAKVLKLFKGHLYSYLKRVHNFDIAVVDATAQLKKSKIPVLFVHGKQDNFVPPENQNILYEATPSTLRAKVVVEDAGHCACYAKAGVEYEKSIIDFLRKHTTIYEK
ncbi:MAG: alpha/beta hydrolase [Clostridia bacterium]|nr:alpha/beta hydrolase [Clostridia bacterium]